MCAFWSPSFGGQGGVGEVSADFGEGVLRPSMVPAARRQSSNGDEPLRAMFGLERFFRSLFWGVSRCQSFHTLRLLRVCFCAAASVEFLLGVR